MQTIQPYFVAATSHYQKKVYDKDGIAHFYRYRQDRQGDKRVIAIPDACVDVLFEKDGNRITGLVAGTVLEKTHIGNQDGKEYFGVRFAPGVSPPGLQVSMKELTQQELPIEAFVHSEWIEKIGEASDGDAWISAFLAGYRELLNNQREKVAFHSKGVLVHYLKTRIEGLGGNISIAQLAEETGYSTRYLHRCFQDQIGLAPKTYGNIIKFQQTIQAIHANTKVNFTELCMNMGYYDQAHFNKIFKKSAALSPKAYQKLIEQMNYNHRLQVDFLFF